MRVADERDKHDPNHWQDTEKVGVCQQRAADARVKDPVVLDPSVSMTSSDRISIAIGPDDSVHVAYADTQTRDVRYVSRP